MYLVACFLPASQSTYFNNLKVITDLYNLRVVLSYIRFNKAQADLNKKQQYRRRHSHLKLTKPRRNMGHYARSCTYHVPKKGSE